MSEPLRRALPLAIVAALATLLVLVAPHGARLEPALAFVPPSFRAPLGFGEAGLDLSYAVGWGVLRSILLASAVGAVALIVGVSLGALAGLRGAGADDALERTCDLVQAFPSFFLALAVLATVRSPSRVHVGAVLALTAWAPFARLAVAEVRVLRRAPFVEAARALGRSLPAIAWVHLAPNLASVALVQLGATMAAVVLGEAAFAFVGLGPGDEASLGTLLEQGVACLARSPHVLFAAAFAIVALNGALLRIGRRA
jgi:ABC-type dipeptide/oligopeptide/nickel transport system permease subunit